MSFDLYLDDTTVKELADAADRNLAAPTTDENPGFKMGKEEGLGTWPELVTVRDTSIAAPKNAKPGDDSAMVIKATLEILGTADGGFPKNGGKTHYMNVYIDKKAVFDRSHDMHALNARRIGTITSLLKAVGVDVSGGVNLDEWFNGEKPLVGQKALAIIRKYKYTNRDKEEVTQTDVDGFLVAA